MTAFVIMIVGVFLAIGYLMESKEFTEASLWEQTVVCAILFIFGWVVVGLAYVDLLKTLKRIEENTRKE